MWKGIDSWMASNNWGWLRCKQGIECRLVVGEGGGRGPAVWNCQIYLHVWLAAACRYHFQTRCVSFTPVYWDPAYCTCTVHMYVHVYWTSTMCVYEELSRPFYSYFFWTSVVNPWHFCADPDPRISTTYLRIRILLNIFFFQSICLIIFWWYIFIILQR